MTKRGGRLTRRERLLEGVLVRRKENCRSLYGTPHGTPGRRGDKGKGSGTTETDCWTEVIFQI
jgi:hypothetical protein